MLMSLLRFIEFKRLYFMASFAGEPGVLCSKEVLVVEGRKRIFIIGLWFVDSYPVPNCPFEHYGFYLNYYKPVFHFSKQYEYLNNTDL